MVFPSVDHFPTPAPVDKCVRACASPPSIQSRYTCDSPLREERNARVFPSGDPAGEVSCPLCVSCIAFPPVVGATQMLLTPRFASMSGVDTVNAAHFPSGETCASEMRCNRIMSSNVMACFAPSCAETINPHPTRHMPARLLRRLTPFILALLLCFTKPPSILTDNVTFRLRIQQPGISP